MEIHLSEEAARYIEAQLGRSGCSSPSEFIEYLLRELSRREVTDSAEKHAWLRAQEEAAARIWDNEADARYDAL
jgi:Arc/MetJ-type ribon-helix-helix transcriptional regulator